MPIVPSSQLDKWLGELCCQSNVLKCKSGQITLDSDLYIGFLLSIWLNKYFSPIFYFHQESPTYWTNLPFFKHIYVNFQALVLLNVHAIFLDKTPAACRPSSSWGCSERTHCCTSLQSFCECLSLPNAVDSRTEIISCHLCVWNRIINNC